MSARKARGYAVVDQHGKILVRTVAPRARGAKVNWLWAYAGVAVLRDAPDAEIHSAWLTKAPEHRASLIEVEIREIEK